MSVAKIKSKLPEGEFRNGLDAIAEELAADPRRTRMVVMLVDCGQVQLDYADDEDPEIPPGLTATARIRRIEAVLPADEETARTLLVRGYEHRAGRTTLNLDTEQDIRRLFDKGDRGAS